MLNTNTFRMSSGFSSEHPVLVGESSRNRLTHIPQFDNAIVLEAEEVDCRNSKVARFQLHARMKGNQITLFDGAINLNGFVRIGDRILFHRCHECGGIALEIRVVVAKAYADVQLIGFLDLARTGELQEV